MSASGSRRLLAAQPISAVPAVAASVLSTDLSRLTRDVRGATRAGAAWVHVDVLDDRAPSGLPSRAAARPAPATLDVHLLVRPAEGLVRALVRAGADLVTFHPEATESVRRTVALVRGLGCGVGLALDAATPLGDLAGVIGDLDLVLLVSLDSGGAGPAGLRPTLERIRALRRRITATGRRIAVEVDGGVRPQNVRELVRAGADVLVAGPALPRTRDFGDSLAALEDRPARAAALVGVA
jgi:ribulose-phosphate 3-epimerase